jgi:hypothetical protein
VVARLLTATASADTLVTPFAGMISGGDISGPLHQSDYYPSHYAPCS